MIISGLEPKFHGLCAAATVRSNAAAEYMRQDGVSATQVRIPKSTSRSQA